MSDIRTIRPALSLYCGLAPIKIKIEPEVETELIETRYWIDGSHKLPKYPGAPTCLVYCISQFTGWLNSLKYVLVMIKTGHDYEYCQKECMDCILKYSELNVHTSLVLFRDTHFPELQMYLDKHPECLNSRVFYLDSDQSDAVWKPDFEYQQAVKRVEFESPLLWKLGNIELSRI
jgi:hypothetical protein